MSPKCPDKLVGIVREDARCLHIDVCCFTEELVISSLLGTNLNSSSLLRSHLQKAVCSFKFCNNTKYIAYFSTIKQRAQQLKHLCCGFGLHTYSLSNLYICTIRPHPRFLSSFTPTYHAFRHLKIKCAYVFCVF